MASTIITYESLKANLATVLGAGSTESEYIPAQGVEIIVPPLPPRLIPPMEDITLVSDLVTRTVIPIAELLKIDPQQKNIYEGGSQVLISADRIVFNTRLDYLMLFGGKGVAIASPGRVNLDSEEDITMYGEDGVFIGVPGKNTKQKFKSPKPAPGRGDPTSDEDYEPMVLGLKLANFLNDLLVELDQAVISGTIGNCRFREDTVRGFQQLACRIPEMLSTFAYVDGISHEPTLKPVPPDVELAEITVVDNVLRGRTTGADTSSPNTTVTSPAPVTNPLSSLAGFYNSDDTQTNANKL